MSQQAKIEIKNLNFFYNDHQVIRDVNMEVRANEIYALFGPANSGTTTLFRALNRLSDLDIGARMEGKILLDGKDIRSNDVNVTELR
ncbi:MAG: ATP-binding cassette domain-containing protein, partial [Erysipelotrichaceae bacterium]|nr:ATP-binding cassette domain-containing protein [Erysipelotrichaceae bacterium]